MAISVTVAGPDFIGGPVIHLSADGDYAPDVMDDMTRHAGDLYFELFADLQTDPEDTDPDREDVSGEGAEVMAKMASLKLISSRPIFSDPEPGDPDDDEPAAA